MEINTNKMEERLWSYIDGNSDADEATVIETLLQENAAWKDKYFELLEVNSLLQSSELDAPSMRFTKNVMEEITKLHIAPATSTYINKRIIWGIAIFFITMIVGFFIYGFSQVNWTSESNSNLPVDFSKIDYSRMFSNTYVNAFMMINVVLGLFLLDRFLATKRRKYRDSRLDG
jgi:hypothetical protein